MAPTTAAAKKPKAMSKKHLDHFEKRLLEERRRVLKELGHYDEAFGSTPQGADGNLSAYSFHMADQGAREGLSFREPGRPVPLASRRGPSSSLPLAREIRQVPQLWCRNRVRASRRAAARAVLHRLQAARRRCKAAGLTPRFSGRFLAQSS
jgi:hypothetical protein